MKIRWLGCLPLLAAPLISAQSQPQTGGIDQAAEDFENEIARR
jgi:hypothetical protein